MAQRAFIIGKGEVGRRLGGALEKSGWNLTWVTRTEGWDEAIAADGVPRLLCMREEDLVAAFDRFPESAHRNLVLVQNGFLEAGLGVRTATATRGLVWFTSKGDFYLPLRASVLHGHWAKPLTDALVAADIPFEVAADDQTFMKEMILKGFWNCVVGLPLAAHGVDLGTYLADHKAEIRAIAEEACAVSAAQYNTTVTVDEALECLASTTGELGWVATKAAKALDWRNGAVAKFGRTHNIPTPVNDRLLATAG